MNHVDQAYKELVHLTQLFLLRNYPLKQKLVVQSDTYACLKQFLSPTAPPIHASAPAPVHPSTELLQPGIPQPKAQPEPTIPELPPQRPHHPLPPIEPPPQPMQPIPGPGIADPRLPDKKDIKLSNGKFSFQLEPVAPAVVDDFSSWRQLWKEQCPHQALLEEIPSDRHSQQKKHAWKINQTIPPIVILSFQDAELSLKLLKNLAKAISLHFMPARVLSAKKIEEEKKWEALFNASHLRLIIAGDYGLYSLPGLMKYYKPANEDNKHYLHHTALLLLSDLNLYLKEPQLKSLLWRTICNELQTAPLV